MHWPAVVPPRPRPSPRLFRPMSIDVVRVSIDACERTFRAAAARPAMPLRASLAGSEPTPPTLCRKFQAGWSEDLRLTPLATSGAEAGMRERQGPVRFGVCAFRRGNETGLPRCVSPLFRDCRVRSREDQPCAFSSLSESPPSQCEGSGGGSKTNSTTHAGLAQLQVLRGDSKTRQAFRWARMPWAKRSDRLCRVCRTGLSSMTAPGGTYWCSAESSG